MFGTIIVWQEPWVTTHLFYSCSFIHHVISNDKVNEGKLPTLGTVDVALLPSNFSLHFFAEIRSNTGVREGLILMECRIQNSVGDVLTSFMFVCPRFKEHNRVRPEPRRLRHRFTRLLLFPASLCHVGQRYSFPSRPTATKPPQQPDPTIARCVAGPAEQGPPYRDN